MNEAGMRTDVRTDRSRDAGIRGVVIFGTTQFASLAWFALTYDSPYEVAAFTVDQAWINDRHLHGLPVVPFETLTVSHPPEDFAIVVPIGWKRMNALRAEKLKHACRLGYRVVTYVSGRASVWPDLSVGSNGYIDGTASVGPFARIGSNCMVMDTAVIAHHVVVHDDCFVAGGAMVCGEAQIGAGSVLGARCVILNGVRVAPRCFVGAGALVNRDTEPGGIYTGMPARRRRHIDVDSFPVVQ